LIVYFMGYILSRGFFKVCTFAYQKIIMPINHSKFLNCGDGDD
jgi:hypothetical protein